MNKALDAAKKSLMDCYDALAGDYGTSEGARKRHHGGGSKEARHGRGPLYTLTKSGIASPGHPNPAVHNFATKLGYTYTGGSGNTHIYSHPEHGQMKLSNSHTENHALSHHLANVVSKEKPGSPLINKLHSALFNR